MTKRRNRIQVHDVHRHLPCLADSADVTTQPLFKIFIHATGQSVLVRAASCESAVYSLGLWLRSIGLDSRVMYLDAFEASDVLSAVSLYNNAVTNLKDDTLF